MLQGVPVAKWNSNSAQFCCEREIKQTITKCKRNQIVENI